MATAVDVGGAVERFVCLHGHFYQPPRENPWLEAIELQDSAYPYHDWNERITAECYGPNARSRILDGDGRISRILNNYSRISFNVGPTLLAWMEVHAPHVYDAVLAADRESAERFSGHGSAIAQAYGHMIMPLSTERDQRTQVLWGIRDFERRFGRRPEGMWLPETAADTASLDAMAAEGIRFTILAPHQAKRVKPLRARKWEDVEGGRVDPTVPYRVRLPSGRSITVFFYDGPVSRAVAFEQLLVSGDRLADRVLEILPPNGANGDGGTAEAGARRLAHIATDGETYGHHHNHGDMALAFALDRLERDESVRVTNYGEFLDLCPPEMEAEIIENTSWSCAHGVERWRSDCGCNTGRGWGQAWRAPLRDALDWLRDRLEPLFEDRGGKLLTDPWAARDDYVDVVLDRSARTIENFLDHHASHKLDERERTTVLQLLEMQRHAMLMYTSCGWFFDELSGIETVQVMQYAGRAIQLAEDLSDEDFEGPFLQRLARAPSNLPEHRDGRVIYEKFVRPAMVDLTKVAAHYAATSLFEKEPTGGPAGTRPLFEGFREGPRVYCYEIDHEEYRVEEAGRARLALGRLKVTSEVTRESGVVTFAALHLGDHNLNVGARVFENSSSYGDMVADLVAPFEQADLPQVVRRLDHHFGGSPYSLRTLFRDEQRTVIDVLLATQYEDAEAAQRQLYERQVPLIRFLGGLGVRLPKAFKATAELVVDADLRRLFGDPEVESDEVRSILEDTATWGLELDVPAHALVFSRTIRGVAERLRERPTRPRLAERLEELVELAQSLPWEVPLWETQNAFYDAVHDAYPELAVRAERGDGEARGRADRLVRLADRLGIRVPEVHG